MVKPCQTNIDSMAYPILFYFYMANKHIDS